jgi:hypothetical protein
MRKPKAKASKRKTGVKRRPSRPKAGSKAKRASRASAAKKRKVAPSRAKRTRTSRSRPAPKSARGRAGSAARTQVAAVAPVAVASAAIDRITTIAADSPIARFNWHQRGRAPAGYIKGMALVYARVYCKLKAGNAAALEMATHSGDPAHDALAWYDEIFRDVGISNDHTSPDTLRHLFVLMLGLGMRESSGKYCEGRDRSVSNTTAETAEAGLFQTSFNARSASLSMPVLFDHYRTNPSGFVDVFKQGVTCSAANLENFGSGDGKEFQRLSKACPAFAAEFAAVGLRHFRKHWGPINRKEAQVEPDADAMFRQVQAVVDDTPGICSDLTPP